jgi:translation initiation factor IF-1
MIPQNKMNKMFVFGKIGDIVSVTAKEKDAWDGMITWNYGL